MAGDAALNRLASLALVFTGKALGLGALLVCGVVVARVAGPTQFALYSTVLSLVLLADACLGAPIDYVVIRFAAYHERDKARSDGIQAAAFRTKLMIGLGLLLCAALFGQTASRNLLQDRDGRLLLCLAAGLTAALLLNRSVAATLQSRAQFQFYSFLDSMHGVLRAMVVAVLALVGATSAAAYLTGLLAASLALLLISLWVVPHPYVKAKWPSRQDTIEASRFLGMTVGVIVLGTITGRTDLLFLAHNNPPTEVAYYAAASQLASVATLFAGYASVVSQPLLIPAARRGEARQLFWESSALALMAASVFLILAFRFGDLIMRDVFGPRFAGAAPLLQYLAVGTSVDLLCMPVFMTFLLQFYPRAALLGELLITAAYLVSVLHVAVLGPVAMAWLVTAVRAAKGAWYIGATIYLSGRRVFASEVKTDVA